MNGIIKSLSVLSVLAGGLFAAQGANAVSRSYPATMCRIGSLSRDVWELYWPDHGVLSPEGVPRTFLCPVPQQGGGTLVSASITVWDLHGTSEIRCFLKSATPTGLTVATSPTVGSGIAFAGKKTLTIAPVAVAPTSTLAFNCVTPGGPQEGGWILSYTVNQL